MGIFPDNSYSPYYTEDMNEYEWFLDDVPYHINFDEFKIEEIKYQWGIGHGGCFYLKTKERIFNIYQAFSSYLLVVTCRRTKRRIGFKGFCSIEDAQDYVWEKYFNSFKEEDM